MCPLAAHVGNCRHHVSRQFLLYIQVPLLNVRPDLLLRERNHSLWKLGADRSAHLRGTRLDNVPVSIERRGNVGLHRILHQWRRAFQRGRDRLLPVCVLEEDTVSAADRQLAVAPGIPGKPDARAGIEQMSLRATCWYSAYAALHHSVEQADGATDSAVLIDNGPTRNILRWIEVIGLLLVVVNSSVQTDT